MCEDDMATSERLLRAQESEMVLDLVSLDCHRSLIGK